ncbi:galactoside-binding lectin [Necator americanus]|uniref:Galectin n=3 Tax=Necator americanus TaxID=51031 RepID=W2TVN3_NECAM|nr:galactoside-binding lectin [Necator americanus]ETN86155.1 galactoside-binding lectin [Necator americanus]
MRTHFRSLSPNATMKWLLVLLVAYAFADEDSKESSEKETKEKNYKKYIGEQNYRLPFKTRVSEAFVVGQTIHAVGNLTDKPTRVDFNFHKGAAKDADLPLHFSIRFDEGIFSGKFVYNTFKDGNWSDNEQRISNPFKAGQEFDLRVRILDGKFQVFANRVEVGVFEQRQPLDGIDHVSIRGDLTKLRLFHYGGRIFPNPYMAVAELKPGKRLDISALPTGKRVNVNLYRENKEYALQVSIRFNEGAIVRNAMNNNVWGKEEREGDMPISKGEVFDLTIINEEFSFQIFFNGKRFATFAHRGSPTDIKTLEIDGDVEIHTVTINDAPGI